MKRKQEIHKRFEKRFGNLLYEKTFNYIVSEQDLYDIAIIFNECIFNNKLPIDEIEIISVPYNSQKDKGNSSFGKYKKENAKFLIQVIKYQHGDNFYQIVNVLAHELIHIYDMLNGPIYKILCMHSGEVLSGFSVKNMNNNQYVGKEMYNAHSDFFKKMMSKINNYGFDVQQYYNINSKKNMKKLQDSKNNKKQKELYHFFNETEESKEAQAYKTVKSIFDCISAPNKRLVYRNSKEWFIEFP